MGRDCPADYGYGVRYSIWHVAQKHAKIKVNQVLPLSLMYFTCREITSSALLPLPAFLHTFLVECQAKKATDDWSKCMALALLWWMTSCSWLTWISITSRNPSSRTVKKPQAVCWAVSFSRFFWVCPSYWHLLSYWTRRVRGLIETPGFAWNRWHRCVGRRWARDGVFYEVTS